MTALSRMRLERSGRTHKLGHSPGFAQRPRVCRDTRITRRGAAPLMIGRMRSAFVFDALKMHLKARGMTYADVAHALKVSEPTVKRIFAGRNCTLRRLDQMCDVLQVELAELARGLPRAPRLISQLTRAQEEELMSDPALLCVAACAMHQMRLDQIVQLYRMPESQCLRLLLRLEKIGILEV